MAKANPILKALGQSRSINQGEPEVEPSLLSKIGNAGLSGLVKVSNVLGLPGSSVSDVLTGNNPFDQWLTPTTSDNRVIGRDALRHFGAIGSEDNTANWWAGLAYDVATDPFTIFGGGGLLKGAIGGGLKGVSRAAPAGAGLLKFAIPFAKNTATELFTGPASRAIADKVGDVAGKIGDSAPMRIGRSMLDSSVIGRTTKFGQNVGRAVFGLQGESQAKTLGLTGKLARNMELAGNATEAGGKALRSQIELPHAGTSPEAQELSGAFMLTKAANDSLGLPANDLVDLVQTGPLGYAPRQLNEKLRRVKAAEQIGGPLGATSSRDKARLQLLKGFNEGTEGVNKLFSDTGLKQKAATWQQSWEAARTSNQPAQVLAKIKKDAIDDLTKHVGQSHGTSIVPTFQPEKGAKKLWKDATGKQIWSKTAPVGASAVMKDRYKGLAELAFDSPEWLDHPIFPNHPLVDAEQYLLSAGNRQAAGEKLYEAIAKVAKPHASANLKETVSVGKIIGTLGFKKQAAAQQLAQRMGIPWTKKTMSEIAKMRVSKEIADDLVGIWPQYQVPRETGLLLNTLDSFTSLFKAGVLTWPARFVRDAMSGAARNIENGWLDGKAFVDAHNLLQGRELSGLTDVRAVRDWLANNNLPINDKNATEAARQIYAQYASVGHPATDVTSAAMSSVVPSLQSILERIPGRVPTSEGQSVAKVGKMIVGQEPGTNLNPMNVRGFNGKLNSTFGPTAAGDVVGKYTDGLNRLSPFLYKLRNGEDPARAMAEITHAQVDYSAKAFTPHERVLKRLLPFYSFSKAQLGYVSGELLNNPGGRMRNTIRATAAARGEDASVPDYLGQGTSIPLGTLEDGSKRFVTGLGLMHEDPLGFAGGPRNALLETASRLNPLIKGPLEYMTGQSFFQRGAEGGRAIEDLDPTIGRIAANLTGAKDAYRWPGSQATEMVFANSPLSRALTTARTLSDPRKDIGTKVLNTATGIRVSDVSPAAQDRALLNQTTSLMKTMGGREFGDTFFPKDQLEGMQQPERALADKLNELKSLLEDRRKARRTK